MTNISSVPFLMLHENPLYVMEQSQRYTHISELAGHLQKVAKVLSHYTNLGKQLCGVMDELIESLNEIEFVCTNSTYEKMMSMMQEIKKSLHDHFEKVSETSENSMKNFIKEDLPELTERKKNHLKQLEKYTTTQEKFLSISKKNKTLFESKQSELDDVLKESTVALFDYISLNDLDELKIEHLIAQFLSNFPKSFMDSLQNLIHLLPDFHSDSNEGINLNEKEQLNKVFNPDFESIESKIREDREKVLSSLSSSIETIHGHMPSQDAITTTSKQGYLYRKKKNSKKFSKKFFTCANGFLSYSKTVENATNPSFSMNLAIATVQLSNDIPVSPSNTMQMTSTEDKAFVFKIVSPEIQLTLQALNQFDYDGWVASIRNGIVQAIESDEVALMTPTKRNGKEIRNKQNRQSRDDFDLTTPEKKKDKRSPSPYVIGGRHRQSLKFFQPKTPPKHQQPSTPTPAPIPSPSRTFHTSPFKQQQSGPITITTHQDESSYVSLNSDLTSTETHFYDNFEHTCCADCGCDNAEWLVINKAIFICENCAGCHRSLGGISMVRSLKLDKLDLCILKMFSALPNNEMNSFYERKLAEKPITPESLMNERQDFITKKYVNHEFSDDEFISSKLKLHSLFEYIKEQNLKKVMMFLFLRKIQGKTDEAPKFLPIHAAAIVGNPYIIAAIAFNDPDQIDKVDENGWTALSYASYYSNKAAITVLITFKASLTISKIAHPLYIALANHRSDIADILLNYSMKDQIDLSQPTKSDDQVIDNDEINKGPFTVNKNIAKQYRFDNDLQKQEEYLESLNNVQLMQKELQHIQLKQTEKLATIQRMTSQDRLQIDMALYQMAPKRKRKSSLKPNE